MRYKLKHGVFFHHVLEGLKGKAANKDGVADLAGLASYAIREVPDAVKEEFGPTVSQTPAMSGDISGLVPLLTVSTTKLPSTKPNAKSGLRSEASNLMKQQVLGTKGNPGAKSNRIAWQEPSHITEADRVSKAGVRSKYIGGASFWVKVDAGLVIWKLERNPLDAISLCLSRDEMTLFIKSKMASTLRGIDMKTGKEKWSLPANNLGTGQFNQVVAVPGTDSVIFFDADSLKATDSDGKLLWTELPKLDNVRGIGATNGTLYLNDGKSLTALQVTGKCEQLWKVEYKTLLPASGAMTFSKDESLVRVAISEGGELVLETTTGANYTPR